MDDNALNPSEFNLIRGIFTNGSTQSLAYRRFRPYLGAPMYRDFEFLDFKLMGMARETRKFLAANVKEIRQTAL